MTPRALDPNVIERPLLDIQTAVMRLEELGDLEAEQLAADWRLRAAVERVLTVLVEAAVKANTHVTTSVLRHAPADYRSSFTDAAKAGALSEELADRLAPSAGLRNVLVHGYDEVDLDLLTAAARRARDAYPQYVVQLAAFARRHGKQD
jgi:uncharacterized protein YutE (UPF0331/DUF86 family)